MKALLILSLLGSLAQAAQEQPESWTVNGKQFFSKAVAINYVMKNSKPNSPALTVMHTKCEILTNKFSFKACPKNRAGNFENLPYQPGALDHAE